ncbi:bifunctional diaminohydroxyphosphoribosylaminopyrimidine deaminase/5-amino-6-(5-phosphoribosylamino)uracil reductase RibD [Mucilaginibacter myungsuensis]|uniref:Riboflavin biosynthesis protein RibD n=1 Tax=Mucilaginibacter myungsuensis TaxID=649104 RepID=A0A929PY01_9SPHI|nr:bifunctional diaminohydroxyphosphoribosylaminopyrimidine deaminase/5-amino-6-(5-phosphoribosylamino)uracil reductase RibD [Mucilaginibacter myungsuensis]MBE9664383.1 bifunctional diaminohydroxyphosphoribosylaminopyrimidine deaminase/5-amino-6-(5-phosphoribosylamino)uracil reductase RibD [Mucilaginibacter myungsuensis]MDN3597094.1 bifunctional diaminohydroxyphosphoribosylaminopyrimidine deaminase/5-amino-6-(5-phosphoribosylamino)uracil reductase RibD [Mucilaginibacter myungsuensis]
MAAHHKYLQRCLDLAKLGAGYVSPNPMVGAVIVCDDTIIGEGYHQRYGEAHAEVNAVNMVLDNHLNAAELLQRSTIYVSLEPCAHYGKTPPCADLIIKHCIPTVVVGCRDPFDQVNGKGIEKLREAGIEVITGILERECLDLNKRFFTHVQKQRPYIILKWAQTADGFFAPSDGLQYWITGPEARKLVHKWRSEEDAVLVGKHTAAIDNPQLNVRDWQGRSPKRVVIDRKLELSTDQHLFDQSVDTFVFNEVKTDVDGKVKYISLEDFDNFVPQYIMFQLYLQDIRSVIIEGGAATLKAFIDAGLWDEARVFTGIMQLKSGILSPDIKGTIQATTPVGNDSLQIILNN